MIIPLALIFIAIALKWGDWKNWKSYYPTILFFVAGDFIHTYLTALKPLWRFSATVFPGVITHLITNLVIFPCIFLVFLPTYTKLGLIKKVLYIALWVNIIAVIEFIGLKFGHFTYFNGWRFAYSVIFDCIIFPLLIIHQRKPLLALILAIIIGIGIMVLFKIPLPH